MRQYSHRPCARSLAWRRNLSGMVVISSRCLLTQFFARLSFCLDDNMLDCFVAVEFASFFFRDGSCTLSSDQAIGALGHFRRGVESEDLLRCWLAGDEASDFHDCLRSYWHRRFLSSRTLYTIP